MPSRDYPAVQGPPPDNAEIARQLARRGRAATKDVANTRPLDEVLARRFGGPW